MRKTTFFLRAGAAALAVTASGLVCLQREGDMTSSAFAQAPPASAEEGDQRGSTTPLKREIHRILAEQQQAWNRGDIDAFMQHYLKSDGLTFSSGGHVTRGWQATRESYRKRYPDRAAMGTLGFSDLEVRPLGDTAALMLGNWQLTREDHPDVGGNFTLIFQRVDERWLIVHDHTSRREEASAEKVEKGDVREP